MTYETKHGDRVRRRILDMGLQLWRVDPAMVTARRIASELDMTHGAVLYHFKHTAALTDAIAFYAVKQGDSRVILSLIAMRHKSVAALSEQERQRHMREAG